MSSRSSLSSYGQASSYYSTSSYGTLGLPGDEFRTLQKRQNRDRLKSHFSHCGSSNYPRPRTSYQEAYLAQDERLRISEVKNATRRALGSNFDFTDEHDRRNKLIEGRRGGGDYEVRIPQKYLDDYHTWSREDDEKYDADQYRADCTPGAQWRAHAMLDVDAAAIRPSTSYRETSRYSTRLERVDSVMHVEDNYARPRLVSKFSFDSDVPVKRRFFRRR